MRETVFRAALAILIPYHMRKQLAFKKIGQDGDVALSARWRAALQYNVIAPSPVSCQAAGRRRRDPTGRLRRAWLFIYFDLRAWLLKPLAWRSPVQSAAEVVRTDQETTTRKSCLLRIHRCRAIVVYSWKPIALLWIWGLPELIQRRP